MGKYLWRVTANKNWTSVVKGMEVDIVVENRSGKPFVREIAKALTNKYGIKDLSGSGLPESTFDYDKM